MIMVSDDGDVRWIFFVILLPVVSDELSEGKHFNAIGDG